MKIIIRAAKILNPKSPFHHQVVDIKIDGETITEIGEKLENESSFEEIKLNNLYVSEGWFDSSVSLGEPGFEEREAIANGLNVAAKSGFTAIALQPNSYPIIDNQSQVNFVKAKSQEFTSELFPIGALTKESLGKDLAELFDMKNAGAIAFGDYNKNTNNPNLLKIALQYAQDFNGLVIAFSENTELKGNGVANEGVVSTRLGLKGIPAMAEALEIARNLFLLEYAGGKLHIPTISSAQSVELIKQAKAKGLDVSCSVAVHHLVLTDETLEEFDSRYKVSPPLRTELDRQALLKGVQDGTIDMITSDHNPIDIEHKKMEFDLAKNGTIGLESAFGTLSSVLPLETIIQKLTEKKSRFGIENHIIDKGQRANITLFSAEGSWTFEKENILSKSKNSAFLGTKMKGKVYGIYNKGKLILA
ncbi:dihydroorotase [Flavobacterium luteum]|uniref:Dihydroorotase n=1 Tax=Flavobacterium luteum TaxID=2026654 RepID=A0A7J5AL88_9FLAO|nr:dihydroorotase [Flavobacterium luteum]KAB1158218.1 dihydroorotase [Flavobacterium luteum]